jgi:DNA-binding MarR family transcriptional regulator
MSTTVPTSPTAKAREHAAPNTAAPAPEPLSSDLCWLLSRASHALTTEFTAALEDSGISPREHSVLATALTGEYTQTELARLVGLDKTTMVVTIDELESARLAERRSSQTDRRTRVIVVTEAGARKVREAEVILQQVREDVLGTLPEPERKIFLRALGKLVCGRLSEPVQCSHPVRRRS